MTQGVTASFDVLKHGVRRESVVHKGTWLKASPALGSMKPYSGKASYSSQQRLVQSRRHQHYAGQAAGGEVKKPSLILLFKSLRNPNLHCGF